ncbi:MAG TPA: helix-hairpin-helix domain-containing protein [Cellvibrio sp.]|nr:helix-hairpin-helix domain-containing protein [Cellvibrio sp.]
MNPAKVDRSHLKKLTDLPNIGKAMAADLNLLGIHQPEDLRDKDPLQLYRDLCVLSGAHQDPCVLDVFISVVTFIRGGPARPWWEFTLERKQMNIVAFAKEEKAE